MWYIHTMKYYSATDKLGIIVEPQKHAVWKKSSSKDHVIWNVQKW